MRKRRLIIIIVDVLTHTDESPYCDDPTCPCHDELDELREQQERMLAAQTQEGYESSYRQFLDDTVGNDEYNAWLDHVRTRRAEEY